ncbi:ATP-dependent helicase [Echinicola strongylocentroti]|uniref:ATP-dependent helicase n=1 Tax=Echinicola strongylocentroti TaxID=1795355 RepID=A0A2Z4IK65_9BACT|nr:DEAD/DEAH box helicase [Echinicola strongylocentroti]AWW31137.1 ATP-dependent helicase [Echinicola strongylocentroti]
MTLSNLNQQTILQNLGISSLNEMQQETLKASKEHANLMLIAPTGSGKTLAYLLSLLEKLEEKEGIQAMVLAPTRELVLQIESVLKQMKLPVKVNACYGGHMFSIERKNFSVPPSILVGTPGRIKDHLERGTFSPDSIRHLIFDEFDKSLEMGFAGQMKYITGQLFQVTDKVLVSATSSIELPYYLDFDDHYTLETQQATSTDLKVQKIVTPKEGKLEGLLALIKSLGKGQNVIVFANHRDACDRIGEFLDQHEVIFSLFRGGLEQDERESQLTKFRNGSAQVLIATDIAARGIDIPELDYVVHYQLPPQETTYLHRNGRTARMKATGTCILLMTEKDYLPNYLQEEPEEFTPTPENHAPAPQFATLHINKGKKDKVNKIDLVGFFLQFDFMEKEDLGLIEVKDFFSYVAVKREKYPQAIAASKGQRIKRKAIKVSLAN